MTPAAWSAAAKSRHSDTPAAPDKSFDAVLAEVLGDVGGSPAAGRQSGHTPGPAATPDAFRRHSGVAGGRTPVRPMPALHTPVRLYGRWAECDRLMRSMWLFSYVSHVLEQVTP